MTITESASETGDEEEKEREATPPKPEASSRPQRGHGPTKQPNLPIEMTVHRFDESPDCGFCGGTMSEMEGHFEESEEITVVEATYKLGIHRRQKYRCRCNAQIATAPGPPKLQPGEREIEGPFPGDSAAQAHRLALRQERSEAVTQEIRDWAFSQGGLRRSSFGKAVTYLLEHWEGLTLFLTDPRIPLDNEVVACRHQGPIRSRRLPRTPRHGA